MSNNISFKSNIRLVSPRYFEKISEKINSQKGEFIDCYDLIPFLNKIDYLAFRTNMEKGSTEGVLSCTAGVVARKGENCSLFMHLFNSKENIKNLKIIKKFFSGTNCILIGSKKELPYSKKLFSLIEKQAKKANLPITKMQGLSPSYEANLAYISNEDTLFVCIKDSNISRNYAKNKNDLKKLFDKLLISKNDKIIDVNRFREFIEGFFL